MGDGVKTLGLHLRATCRGVVLLIFGSIYFRSCGVYYCVYRQSHPSKIIYYLCSSKSIEVRVGLLLKYMLRGRIVTESKCSRIT